MEEGTLYTDEQRQTSTGRGTHRLNTQVTDANEGQVKLIRVGQVITQVGNTQGQEVSGTRGEAITQNKTGNVQD